jgi:type II secretory pathway pseudopilin PulG
MMNKKIHSKAFTLIEITLVLGLTLGLAAALIFGLSAFTNGADRAKCILNINNVQKAVRSLQNLNEFKPGDTAKILNHTTLWGSKDAFLSSRPVCPRATLDQDTVGQNFDDLDGKATNYKYYGASTVFPDLGVAYIQCLGGNVNAAYLHNPKEIDGIRVDASDANKK